MLSHGQLDFVGITQTLSPFLIHEPFRKINQKFT